MKLMAGFGSVLWNSNKIVTKIVDIVDKFCLATVQPATRSNKPAYLEQHKWSLHTYGMVVYKMFRPYTSSPSAIKAFVHTPIPTPCNFCLLTVVLRIQLKHCLTINHNCIWDFRPLVVFIDCKPHVWHLWDEEQQWAPLVEQDLRTLPDHLNILCF